MFAHFGTSFFNRIGVRFCGSTSVADRRQAVTGRWCLQGLPPRVKLG
jgi:hypothetical protein